MVHGVVRETVADLVHGGGRAFVESKGYVPGLELPPHGVVVWVVPVASVDYVGAHECRPEPERVHGLAYFIDSRLNVEWGYHSGSPHALGGYGAEIAHPAGIGPGYGVTELGVHGVQGQGEEPAAGVQESHVYALGVHCPDLRCGVPAVGKGVCIDNVMIICLDDLL